MKTIVYLFNNINNDTFLLSIVFLLMSHMYVNLTRLILWYFFGLNQIQYYFVWQVELQLFNLQQKKEGNRMMKFIFFNSSICFFIEFISFKYVKNSPSYIVDDLSLYIPKGKKQQ